MNHKELVSSYRNAIWDEFIKREREIKSRHNAKIEVLCELAGVEINRHDFRPMQEIVEKDFKDEKIKQLILKSWEHIEKITKHSEEIYRLIYEMNPRKK